VTAHAAQGKLAKPAYKAYSKPSELTRSL
jgi:hypothetical protein